MIDVGVSHIVSVFSGFAVSSAFILKLVKDLERAVAKIDKISSDLASISARIESWDHAQHVIAIHDRKIAALENQVYGTRGS